MARRSRMLLMRHDASGFEIDVSLASMSFEVDAIRRAQVMSFADGVPIPVATPEDLIVFKVIAWRPRDQEDVTELLLQHLRRIDLNRVRTVLAPMLEAIDGTVRMSGFEDAVRRARRLQPR